MQTEVISDAEQTEIFNFYFVPSYNSGVYVLDYGNNDKTPPKGRSNSNKPLKIQKIP